jgi:CRISPR-associated protein Csd2
MPTRDTPITNRYDIVYFFDVTDGNPNGDPDAGNMPRIDPETNHGLVTDVCLKRKVRNYVTLKHQNQPPNEIYVKEKAVLNDQHERAYQALKLKPESKKLPKDDAKARELTAWMCANFFDIRTFGAVMSTDVNCGQVRGPIQFSISRSVHPVLTLEHAVTRCAVTNKKDQDKERTIGRKFSLPYGLYQGKIYISPLLADPARFGTGFSLADLDLFKEALANMFEHDRSAARGAMSPVACFAFRHDHAMGNARADELFSLVRCTPVAEVASATRPPRAKSDFNITLDDARLPKGVNVERWV